MRFHFEGRERIERLFPGGLERTESILEPAPVLFVLSRPWVSRSRKRGTRRPWDEKKRFRVQRKPDAEPLLFVSRGLGEFDPKGGEAVTVRRVFEPYGYRTQSDSPRTGRPRER